MAGKLLFGGGGTFLKEGGGGGEGLSNFLKKNLAEKRNINYKGGGGELRGASGEKL